MAFYDLGTIRIYENSGVLEVFFPRGDRIAHETMKSLKGRFEPNRRSWKIEPRYARMAIPDIVERITENVLQGATEDWRNVLPKMVHLVTTTRDYGLYAGAGGLRVELPRGHRHEYTLRDEIPEAMKDGAAWLIPSASCLLRPVKVLIADIIKGDRALWAKSVDHMEGFNLSGQLDLVEGEAESLGLEEQAVVFAEPSFVRRADKGIPSEPVKLYPLQVLRLEEGRDEDGVPTTSAKLAFVTGDDSHRITAKRLLPGSENNPVLDVRHVKGKWTRRRR